MRPALRLATLAGCLLACMSVHAATGARPGFTPDPSAPEGGMRFLPNATITEGFDAVGPGGATPSDRICLLTMPGWFARNNSTGAGTTCVFQGNPLVFNAQQGPTNSYAAMSFNSTTGNSTISTWLLTPEVNFGIGATLRFYTRSVVGGSFPDRLQVRVSTAGASTNVGTTPTDVGDFGTLLLDINPNLVGTDFNCGAGVTDPAGGTLPGYPQSWCQINLTSASGLPSSGTGRIAFRYFVTSGGPAGANSDFIGIDTFSYFEGIAGEPALSVDMRVLPGAAMPVDVQTACAAASTSVTLPFGGGPVRHCYRATNTGTLTLQTHNLSDTAFANPILTNFQFTLAPSASSPWVISDPATLTGPAPVSSTATWSACAQADTCVGAPANTSASATASVTVNFAAPAVVPIPTNSLWGLLALVLGLVMLGGFTLRRG